MRKRVYECFIYLPFPCIETSVRCLPDYMLKQQQIDASKCLLELKFNKNLSKNIEPAAKMFKNYEELLKLYHNICVDEIRIRKLNHKCRLYKMNLRKLDYPHWFGNDKLHSNHRCRLLYYDIRYFIKFGWMEKPNLYWYWPVQEARKYKNKFSKPTNRINYNK